MIRMYPRKYKCTEGPRRRSAHPSDTVNRSTRSRIHAGELVPIIAIVRPASTIMRSLSESVLTVGFILRSWFLALHHSSDGKYVL